jgi:hypothetical protein
MLKFVLAAMLFAIPLDCQSQNYADSPFYKRSEPVPATALAGGQGMRANGVVIDLSESVPSSAPGFEKIRGWSVGHRVDGTKPAQIFHFYIQYDKRNTTFGYDLLVEPVEGTDKIKCTFSSLTDPPGSEWMRNKGIVPIALSADLTPLVIKSGDTISIKMLPLGQNEFAVIQYLQLRLIDPADTH